MTIDDRICGFNGSESIGQLCKHIGLRSFRCHFSIIISFLLYSKLPKQNVNEEPLPSRVNRVRTII